MWGKLAVSIEGVFNRLVGKDVINEYVYNALKEVGQEASNPRL